MTHALTLTSYEAALEELGPYRSPVAELRTAAHAACVRRRRFARGPGPQARAFWELGITASDIRRAIRDGIGS